MPIFVSYRLLKSLKTCASIAHHVVGNAVADDENLPVADDFAGGLVLLLSFGDCCFLGDLEEIVEISPPRSQLVDSNGACGYMDIAELLVDACERAAIII